MEYLGVFVLVSSFVILLVLGVPIAFSIGIAGILTMLVSIDIVPAITTFAHTMATGLDSFTLLAIPFFILAGNIMNQGGIALKLIDFARVIVGRLPGGLAFVNILANMLFGAISGSAAASASAIGTIMGPELEKEKYPKNFSTAINITSATTGLSIPPSNILIVYSLASGGASIAALFMAGYIPGILTGLALMLVAGSFALRRQHAVSKEHSLGDIGLTIINLTTVLLISYIFVNYQLNWIYLVIFGFWVKSLLRISFRGKNLYAWIYPIIGIGSSVIYYLISGSFTIYTVAPALMGFVPLITRKGHTALFIQTIFVAVAINLHGMIHYITTGILFIYLIILILTRNANEETLNDLFKGTKKFLASLPSLLLLVIVIGGIIAGIFTATEASAVAVLYALVLAFVYNQIGVKDIPEVLMQSIRTTAIVLLLVAASIALSWIMSFENIPQNVSEALLTLSDNKFLILIIINLILLFVGVFMDMTPAVLIFTPIFLPIVTSLGLDPIHFGIIMVLNLSVGLC
ncbi:MAG: TRAP transporter large permease, partial [Bacteroidota bacterium]